jgi:hypothetical protein
MHHPIVLRRLWLLSLWFLVIGHVIAATSAALAVRAWAVDWARANPLAHSGSLPTPSQTFVDPYRCLPFWTNTESFFDHWIGVSCVATLVIPLAFFALRQTLVRSCIRSVHVCRGAAYSLAWIPVLSLVFFGARALSIATSWRPWVRGGPSVLAVDRWFDWVRDSLESAARTISGNSWSSAAATLIWQLVFWTCFARLNLRLSRAWAVSLTLVFVSCLLAFGVVGLWPGSTLLQDVANAVVGLKP